MASRKELRRKRKAENRANSTPIDRDKLGPEDQHVWVLEAEAFDEFVAMLDAPPKHVPVLRELMDRPSLLDPTQGA